MSTCLIYLYDIEIQKSYNSPCPLPLLPPSPLLAPTAPDLFQVLPLRTLVAQPVINALAHAHGRRTFERVVGIRPVGREEAECGAELEGRDGDVVWWVAADVEGVGVVAHFCFGLG
ncbi:hypothetical protein MMC16_002344 [Acarospora aff. strigata]|nr:hypothetical protein [Acarospora aff. strigata]